jgi:hypothetical protein
VKPNMKLIPAAPAHFDLLELRDQERISMEFDPQSGLKAKQLIDISIASTMIYQGTILCILGYYEIWPGVLNVWIFPSIYVVDHATVYLRTVKKYIDALFEMEHIHRIQSNAISDALHADWMRFLGFENEGKLRKYTADKVNYNCWAMIKEDTP